MGSDKLDCLASSRGAGGRLGRPTLPNQDQPGPLRPLVCVCAGWLLGCKLEAGKARKPKALPLQPFGRKIEPLSPLAWLAGWLSLEGGKQAERLICMHVCSPSLLVLDITTPVSCALLCPPAQIVSACLAARPPARLARAEQTVESVVAAPPICLASAQLAPGE